MASFRLANVFEPDSCHPEDYQRKFELLVSQAKTFISSTDITLENFKRFIQFFYVELAFSGDQKNYFFCQYSLLHHLIDYRTGIPVSLAIVFQSMAIVLGFDVVGLKFPDIF